MQKPTFTTNMFAQLIVFDITAYITLSKCSLVKPDPTCAVLLNCIQVKILPIMKNCWLTWCKHEERYKLLVI